MPEMVELEDTQPSIFPGRRRSNGDGGNFVSPHQEIKEQSHVSSNRPHYVLGDSPQCLSHMIIETCPQAAFERVSRLNVHDFAFVKRTNGSWSYAILASRYVDTNNEEHMVFVLNGIGATKIFKRSQWASCVCCVAMIVTENREQVPKTISVNKDDCSLISSI